jgi:YD repeat-containing protein
MSVDNGIRPGFVGRFRFSKPPCQHIIRIIALLVSVMATPTLAASNDIPAEISYYYWADPNSSTRLFTTAQEACAYVTQFPSNNNPYYNPVGVDNFPSYGVSCTLTQIDLATGIPGVYHFTVGLIWASQSCPTGYYLNPYAVRTCSITNPKAFPKYPIASSNSCPFENMVGNPIYTGYGNKLQRETDYSGSDASALKFERAYNSTLPVHNNIPAGVLYGSLAANWLHTYNRSLKVASNGTITTMYVYRPDGRLLFFSPSAGSWIPDADITDKVIELKDTLGVITGYQYTIGATQEVETYDMNGRILSIKDRSGLTETLSYSCSPVSVTCPVATPTTVAPYLGLLIKVTDNFGNTLNFTYNAVGQMATLTDPANNITRYSYDTVGNLKTVTYPDDTPADLTNNPKKTYVYGSDAGETVNTSGVLQPNALTGIIDENGVRYATYKYDASGKAISTEHAGSVEKYSLNYAPDGTSTAVTDPLGSIRTTHFTTILGVVKPTGTDQPGGSGCSAASSAMTYDANGNVASRTDFNGHKTCYGYDLTRNLETARVEGLPSVADCATNLAASSLTAPARKITSSWHSTYRLPLQVAAPKLLTTTAYDASGNVLTKTEQATTDQTGVAGLTPTVTGNPRTWTYTYNSFGQVLTADGPRTDVVDKTTTTYYPDTDPIVGNRGNIKDITTALGQKTVYNSYDGNGRLLQMTAPNGVVTAMTYFPRGWLKTLTVTGGTNVETTQYTYDPTGLLKTVTAPDTSVLSYGYDAAHRLTSVTDSLGNKVSYTLDAMGNHTNEQATDPSNVLRRNITRVYDALNRLQTVTGAAQ